MKVDSGNTWVGWLKKKWMRDYRRSGTGKVNTREGYMENHRKVYKCTTQLKWIIGKVVKYM